MGRACGWCGASPARPYPAGPLCAGCAPPANPTPDPARTLDALRAAAGLEFIPPATHYTMSRTRSLQGHSPAPGRFGADE